MNLDKLATVLALTEPPPYQHGTDEGARRPAETRVSWDQSGACGYCLMTRPVACKPRGLPPGPAFIRVPRRVSWPYESLAEWTDDNVFHRGAALMTALPGKPGGPIMPRTGRLRVRAPLPDRKIVSPRSTLIRIGSKSR